MSIIVSAVINIVIAVFSGYLLFLLQKANKKYDAMKQEKDRIEQEKTKDEKQWKDAIAQAVIQLLRIQLCEYHAKYTDPKVTSIPTYAYDNWCRMYKQYKELGGNGMITHMNEEIEQLNMKNR